MKNEKQAIQYVKYHGELNNINVDDKLAEKALKVFPSIAYNATLSLWDLDELTRWLKQQTGTYNAYIP